MTEFISRMYGKEGYEIIIKTDSYEHYRAAVDFARRLIDHSKPKTNADRIRAMSDEELAVWIVEKTEYQESVFTYPTYLNFLTESDDTKEGAIKGTVDWLQQPVVEDDNG